jgi:hypothetical protein
LNQGLSSITLSTCASISALLGDTSLSALLISRELLQLLLIDVLQLWAVQLAQYATEGLVYQVEYVQCDIWLGICSSLVGEASGIVALEQFCTVEDASSEIGDIDTGESVSLAEVTTNVEELGLCETQS